MLFPITLLLNLLAIHLYLRYAKRNTLLAHPTPRSSHQHPTISSGGLFFAPTFITLLLLTEPGSHHLTIAAILLAAGISFLDDIYGVPIPYRLATHFLSAGLILYDLHATWPPLAFLLALFLISSWLNAFNFMDGINGITAAYAAVFFGSLGLLPFASHIHRPVLSAVIPGMLAAILAFAWFNFRKKAHCFAGDVGSISLALIIAWTFLLYWQGPTTLYLLLFPALYAIDSVMTICLRLYRRENILQAHRTHLYEHLANEAGWDHRAVATLYGILQLSINLLAIYIIAPLPSQQQFPFIFLTYLALCLAYFTTRHFIFKNHIQSTQKQ